MHNLKERLAHLQLSDAQKVNIKFNIKNQPKKQRSFVPIILPSFILLSVFLIMVNMWPNSLPAPNVSDIHSGANDLPARTIQLPLPVIFWNVANSLLILLMYHYFKKSVASVLRWQHNARMQEWHAFLHKPYLSKLLVLVTIALLWIGAILFSSSLWYSQTIYVALLMACFSMTFIYESRDRQWSACPHCQTRFTRKQILKKSFVPFREKCDACQQLIYVDPRENQNKLGLFFVPLISSGHYTLFDLHPLLALLLGIGLFASLYHFCLPYMLTFSDKEKLLKEE